MQQEVLKKEREIFTIKTKLNKLKIGKKKEEKTMQNAESAPDGVRRETLLV